MQASDVMDIRFREAFHAALIAACEASGCAGPLRKAYAAAFSRGNPKHALAILRGAVHRADETTNALQHFKAHALGLMADIEAAIPPEPEPDAAQS